MTAARTLTDADVEAIAERVAQKLRPRPKARAPERAASARPEDVEAMTKLLRKRRMLPPRR